MSVSLPVKDGGREGKELLHTQREGESEGEKLLHTNTHTHFLANINA
jgi:hypothetical protein